MATTLPTTTCSPLKKRGLSLFSACPSFPLKKRGLSLFSAPLFRLVPLFRLFSALFSALPKSRDRGFVIVIVIVIVIVVVVVVVAVVIVVAIECARC
ncbi:hypothetical protein [Thiohalocapsa sp. ML1]|uniref:hypothetical protein n=1 Tax=Thiohalocapsa sp. ML1 TaxID=1431688 RepID=UPI0012E36655|nr:hypothetical protein [Thiohalocapsa sp. ML1]